jgi:hypothetical protein
VVSCLLVVVELDTIVVAVVISTVEVEVATVVDDKVDEVAIDVGLVKVLVEDWVSVAEV